MNINSTSTSSMSTTLNNNNSKNDDDAQFTTVTVVIALVVGFLGLLFFFFVDVKITKREKPGGKQNKQKKKLPLDSQPDHSIIECDAIDCTNINPTKKCGRCKLVYYCNSNCQKQHWKLHKKDCHSAANDIYTKLDLQKEDILVEAGKGKNDDDQEEKDVKTIECSICLGKKDIKNLITLKKCNHTFCFSCLARYQSYRCSLPNYIEDGSSNNNNSPCPVCKNEEITKEANDNTNARDSILSKAMLLAARGAVAAADLHKGNSSGKSQQQESKRDKLNKACSLAIEQMKTLGKPESDSDVLQRNTICGTIATIKGDYKDALMIYQQNQRILTKLVQRKKKIDELLQKGQALGNKRKQQEDHKSDDDDDDDNDYDDEPIDTETYEQMQQVQNEIMSIMAQGELGKESDLIDCKLECIRLHLAMEEWETAQNLYQQIMSIEYPDQSIMSSNQQLRVLMGFAKCCYYQHNYDGCINLGKAAVQMNRHYPNVHKYIALSYKAKGKIQEAQTIMGRAVLYETATIPAATPLWDDDVLSQDDHRASVRELWIQMMEEE